MNKNQIIKNLSDIYYTLNQVNIKGETNIQYMYGIISVLKETMALLDEEEVTEEQ